MTQYPVDVKYEEGMELQAKCDDCLEDGFALPQTIARGYETETNWSKANTFMASKSRLDDDRMKVAKAIAGERNYLVRSFTVAERETMIGLPKGYVSEACKTNL